MPKVHLIPPAEIDESSLTRDRTALDDDALVELRGSIAVSGLRMPIEVYELAEPRGPHRYGLISGFRRLAAFRELAEMALDKARYAAIPAFLRAPKSAEEVYIQMVEENAIRAEVSPWEQAMVAVRAARAEVYAGIDAAIDALYGNLDRFKRGRLRTIAHLAEELQGYLTAPETLSERQLLRLAPLIPAATAS
jgi:ParB family transcriptional regulator, chromosome partitioning protein